ncbi:serine/threonine-protein kinase [Streptomyces glaucescens]|uniref:non-specific serine/threonine protein kinase n=1 Tax=Streptomyces glaucescens TaxID=1907 RepID=A0A089XDR5_STRGA|nr:serine/threonine-protein kinase [Streptomyces glaucescens]AIS00062.1 serine/threonine protein kinase [Streptomyces glaucescens]
MGDAGGRRPHGERVVGGRYRLVERIGSGGMGTVWRAHDELVSREVAVKQPRLPGDPEDEVHRRAVRRLRREARAAARVDHPSAVAVHDVVEEDGLPWIVMELVRGESLHEVLRRGPLEPAEAARIGLAVLGALRAAHAAGIVHRDVKPANVLLGRHGRVVLTDFGIAHVQGEDSLTASGEFVGSLEFVAPERMSGRGAGPSSDLWSLGILLYAAVEGWSPFRRTAPASTLAAILTAELPEPRRAGPLGPLLVRLLEKDPAARPDAAGTAAALESAAREAKPGERPRRWPAPSQDPAVQDVSALAEFGDDIGTVPLGAAPAPAAVAAPGPAAVAAPGPAAVAAPAPAAVAAPAPAGGPRARRAPHHRALPLALLGGLLAGAVWFGVPLFTGPDGGAVPDDAKGTSTGRPAASSAPGAGPGDGSAPGGWIAHPEREMGVTLALPPGYEEFARQGSAAFQPRVVEYAAADGPVQVRLTKWDRAPGSPLGQARQHAATFEFFGDAHTRYTPTRFQGREAVRSDSTYGDEDLRKRVVELFVRTGDGALWELRVEMPEGGAEEREGMAVFAGARDRLGLATSSSPAQHS